MKRSTIARTFATGVVAALTLGLAPLAKAEPTTCSKETIKGAFARRDTGFVSPPNAAPVALAGLSVMTFDGGGRFTSTGFSNLTPGQSTSTGTYSVNPDCTGHYESDNAPGRVAFFVIVDGGNGIEILPSQTAAITCVARRIPLNSGSKD
jgi:hypothetical protein